MQFLNTFFPPVVLNPGNVLRIAGMLIGETVTRSEALLGIQARRHRHRERENKMDKLNDFSSFTMLQKVNVDCAEDVMDLLTKYDFDSKFSRLEQDFAKGDGGESLEPQRQAIMVDLISFRREIRVRNINKLCELPSLPSKFSQL